MTNALKLLKRDHRISERVYTKRYSTHTHNTAENVNCTNSSGSILRSRPATLFGSWAVNRSLNKAGERKLREQLDVNEFENASYLPNCNNNGRFDRAGRSFTGQPSWATAGDSNKSRWARGNTCASIDEVYPDRNKTTRFHFICLCIRGRKFHRLAGIANCSESAKRVDWAIELTCDRMGLIGARSLYANVYLYKRIIWGPCRLIVPNLYFIHEFFN